MGWYRLVMRRSSLVPFTLFACTGNAPSPGVTTDTTSSGDDSTTAVDPDTSSETIDPDTTTETTASETTTGDPAEICASAHAGTTADADPVTICTTFHAAAPLVHLPADTATTFYGSVDMATLAFITRDGIAHPITSADGSTPFTCDVIAATCTDLPELAGLHADAGPTHRWIFTIYRAEGSLHDGTLHVSSIAPEVLVEGAAIDSLLDRAYEGTITTRVVPFVDGDPIFTQTTTPIRLEPTGERNALTPMWGGESLADATADQVILEVANLTASTTLSDGSCATPLADLGDANPLLGATGTTVTLERVASMHGLGGHHIVLGNYPAGTLDLADGASSMGDPLGMTHPLTAPAMWLAETIDLDAPLSSSYFLHGNAFIYNLVLTLAPTDAGGEDCGR